MLRIVECKLVTDIFISNVVLCCKLLHTFNSKLTVVKLYCDCVEYFIFVSWRCTMPECRQQAVLIKWCIVFKCCQDEESDVEHATIVYRQPADIMHQSMVLEVPVK